MYGRANRHTDGAHINRQGAQSTFPSPRQKHLVSRRASSRPYCDETSATATGEKNGRRLRAIQKKNKLEQTRISSKAETASGSTGYTLSLLGTGIVLGHGLDHVVVVPLPHRRQLFAEHLERHALGLGPM